MTTKERLTSRKFISVVMMAVAFYTVLVCFLVAVFKLPVEKTSILKDYLIFITPTFFATVIGYQCVNVVQKKIMDGKNKKQ